MSALTPRFVVIAGPCVLEDDGALNLEVAYQLADMAQRLDVDFYFKSSYDKANRTSNQGYRGPGVERGLDILASIGQKAGVKLLTDIHLPEQAAAAAAVVDMLQIPAFLCRQTDLLVAAAETGKALNIKKGQFLSPPEMGPCAQKVLDAGAKTVYLTERGTTFGYNNLVVDMRSIPIMQGLGYPVIFDATHSVQQPGGLGNRSGGQRQYVATLAKAAVAAGCSGLFLETHPNPDAAPSDGPNMVPLHQLEDLLKTCLRLRHALTPELAI